MSTPTSTWTSALLGAAAGVVVSLPLSWLVIQSPGNTALGLVSCLVIFVGPLVAVWHYTTSNSVSLPLGKGATLGLQAGLLGAVIGFALGQLLTFVGVFPDAETIMQAAQAQQREAMADQGMSQEEIDQAMEMGASIGGLFSSPLMQLVMGAVSGVIVGALGGMLGAIFFKKGPRGEAA